MVLIVSNIFLGIIGIYLFYIEIFLLFSWWGKGPFITNQLLGISILITYILFVISMNQVLLKGINFYVRSLHSKLKLITKNFRERLRTKKGKIIHYTIGLLIILLINNLYFYIVPKYADEELFRISLEKWEEISTIEKYRIGQSLYIYWKNSEKGLYKASDYIKLIQNYIDNVKSEKNIIYDDIGDIVFYSLSGT